MQPTHESMPAATLAYVQEGYWQLEVFGIKAPGQRLGSAGGARGGAAQRSGPHGSTCARPTVKRWTSAVRAAEPWWTGGCRGWWSMAYGSMVPTGPCLKALLVINGWLKVGEWFCQVSRFESNTNSIHKNGHVIGRK